MPSNSKRQAQMSASHPSHNPASRNAVGAEASSAKPNASHANNTTSNSAQEHQVIQPTVNRKKQKRRNKQAARLAAERQLHDNGASSVHSGRNGSIATAVSHESSSHSADHHEYAMEDEEAYYTDEEAPVHLHPRFTEHLQSNGLSGHPNDVGKRKKKKKGKKNRSASHTQDGSTTSHSTPLASAARILGPPSLSSAALRSAHRVSKDRIWNTSTQEERENIKEFWLQLGEEERRSLVKVEKEAVLRKMKEQQKHSCSCTVCGRKRTAIEEELEVLYDAYYEELEQYAHHNHGDFGNGTPIGAPRRLYQSSLHSFGRHSPAHSSHHPSRGRIQEMHEEEDLEEDEYDDEDEEDEDDVYSDDDLDEATRATRADFFAFGNSLTVKDGILTVADDLLKNDGKHFIDMMEQLAERRMQREEDMQYAAASAAHQSMHAGHNHGPPLDEEDYDDEDEEEYDSQDDEDYDDEMDSMTEEQRMEEGRRMFQIFAARMFEQRVLTAYREKVARERQQKLIEELEEENRLDAEREARKAREAQKKKDRKRLQKQAKEEERARKEAERAAEEAAKKAEAEKKLEEQRRRKEEQRKKKEAERKAQEEERLRKEAERLKRQREERERQAEAERKQREQKERERKKREEAKKKEREEREAKEKAQREKKAKEERERKAREERERQEKEAAEKAERESRERAKREEQAAQQAAAQGARRGGHPPIPPGFHPHQQSLHSPHFQVTTPIMPKVPTPRPRQASHQGSHASSPRSQPAAADLGNTPISPGATGVTSTPNLAAAKGVQPSMLHHPQPSTPLSPLSHASRVPHSMGLNSIHPLGGMGSNPPGLGGIPHRFQDMQFYPGHAGQMGGPFRGAENIPLPPGIMPPRASISGRGFPLDTGHAGLPFHSHPHPPHIQPQTTREGGLGHTHTSTTLESQAQTTPISRPTPIQRPASTVHHDKGESKREEANVDEITQQLGSRALLDDTDVPLSTEPSQPIPIGLPPGPPGPGSLGFGLSPFSQSLHSLGAAGSGGTWGTQMFAPPGFTNPPSWGVGQGGWPGNAFGMAPSPHRPHTSRPVAIRHMVIQACKHLTAVNPNSAKPGFHDVNTVLRHIEQLNPPGEPPVSLSEMLDICDTEGNPQNGGGSFVIQNEEGSGTFVKFESDVNVAPSGKSRGSIAPGDIGSPVPGSTVPAPGPTNASRQFHPSTITPPGF